MGEPVIATGAFCVGATIGACYKSYEMHKTIDNVASNTASEDEMQVFELGIRDEPSFREVVVEWQIWHEERSKTQPPPESANQRRKAWRLKTALERIRELPGQRLQLPLLPEDTSPHKGSPPPAEVGRRLDQQKARFGQGLQVERGQRGERGTSRQQGAQVGWGARPSQATLQHRARHRGSGGGKDV